MHALLTRISSQRIFSSKNRTLLSDPEAIPLRDPDRPAAGPGILRLPLLSLVSPEYVRGVLFAEVSATS